MQKAKWIVLLAVGCILAMSISAYAQIPSKNWPKSGHDYHNSGHNSAATSIAKPIPEWQVNVDAQTTPARWNTDTNKSVTHNGIQTDPDGNIYLFADFDFALAKYDTNGNFIWYKTKAEVGYDDSVVAFNGITICGNDTSWSILSPLGYLPSSHGLIKKINADGTIPGWITSPKINTYICTYPGYATSQTPFSCDSNIAVGPDGTVYWGNMRCSPADPQGPVMAYNSLDGTEKWHFNTASKGQGRMHGSYAVGYLGGNNIIYSTGFQCYEHSVNDGIPSIIALRDDGTASTYLWGVAGNTNAGCFQGAPVLSDDESTVYCAGKQTYMQSRSAIKVGFVCSNQFVAYNTSNGSVKFKLATGGNHAYSPALGSGNMIYVCGGTNPGCDSGSSWSYPPGSNPAGNLVAIWDGGQNNGVIKWTMVLPDDGASDTTACATITDNDGKNVIYLASGNGRIYCIRDEGEYGKILWEYFAPDLKYTTCSTSCTMVPPNLAINDDGSVLAVLKGRMFKFPAGFSISAPEGITGTVKDADGNPIANAWVSVSTYSQPLADNPNRMWTKTNADGTYQITPKFDPDATFPVSYNVAACALNYEGSDNITVTFSAANTKISGTDFTLESAKYDWARTGTITASNENTSYPAANAIDGLVTGSWATRCQATSLPVTYTIDLGSPQKIDEAVIYWWWIAGASYTLEYSTDNGVNWNPAYATTVTDNRGFPVDFYGANPTVAFPVKITAGTNIGGQKTAVDVIKIPSSVPEAQLWKLTITSARYGVVGGVTSLSSASTPSMWEIELRDPSKVAAQSTVGGARALEVGQAAIINDAVVTATCDGGGVPTDTIFIESDDRNAGMRVYKSGVSSSIHFGDRVYVYGTVAVTADGEKYINAGTVARLTTTTDPACPLPADMAMNNKAAADAISQGMLVDTWGKVSNSTAGSGNFAISDGSASPIKVLCSTTMTQPVNDDYIRVRGVVGKDADGPVLYMRNERADWVYGADDMHALPFTGAYDYPIQYLVLGPFTTDPAPTNAYDLIDEDFIGETSIGTTVMPSAGLTTAGKTWTVGTSANGILDINSVLGGTNASSAAYVQLYLWSETEAPAVAIVTGSDDWLKVYVNGVLQYTKDESEFPTGRSCAIGQDGSYNITLHQGLNSLLFKVVNNTGTFKLSSQFVDSDSYGGTGYGGYTQYMATGLGYSLNPATP
ncbi:MAG: discoidin domain-containing protein [Armatimonadota bacterium]